ncbi:MAG: response regulator [Desulfuromonadaceae bacterium]
MNPVLIIEDNPDNLALIEFILHKNGYTTQAAITGSDGVDKALSSAFAFIILDIQLPGIEGTEVLKIIRSHEREHPECTPVPIIAMTSYAMSGDREKLLAAGCNGYIEKPIEPLEVMQQINLILQGET